MWLVELASVQDPSRGLGCEEPVKYRQLKQAAPAGSYGEGGLQANAAQATGHAAVHPDDLAGDVAGAGRAQKRRQRTDVIG